MGNTKTNAALTSRLDKFLKTRSESKRGGWAPVSDEDMEEIAEIFQSIIELKFGPDCDGDFPVEFNLVNRNTHYRMHFVPVPYDHRSDNGKSSKAILNDYVDIVTLNWEIAHGEFAIALKKQSAALRELRAGGESKDGASPKVGRHEV